MADATDAESSPKQDPTFFGEPLALAKFEEPARYAPHCCLLHLKWGEALEWSGKREEARKQFAIAAHLFLAPRERAQFAKLEAGNR